MPAKTPEEKAVRKSVTLPAELINRLARYEAENKKATDKINVSAVCSDAIDEELCKRGY